MKKTIVQIKDINWYETNRNEHGIVYRDPVDDTDFFSRGQSIYCGKISEVLSTDSFGSYKLKIDNGEWLFKEWMFSSIEEKDITNDIIEAEFKENFPSEELEELLDDMTRPVEERIDKIEELSDNKVDKQSEEWKVKIINEIATWGLSFPCSMVVMNIISSDKNDIKNYKSLINISIALLQNELKDLEKEK